MLQPAVENYIRLNTNGYTLQTTCRPPQTLREYALDFQRDSACSLIQGRSSDGLTRIDTYVAMAVSIQALDHIRIAYISKLLIMDLYRWSQGFNPVSGVAISSKSQSRRNSAVNALLADAYIWYRYSYEASNAERKAIGLMRNQQDIPFDLYRYRFSRSGFNLHNAQARLYRGDTRPPAALWQAGGFYPKMDAGRDSHDPHLGSGASNQVISTTTDPNIVARFAWHNKAYCPKRFYYIHYGDTPKAIAGFVYEVAKQGHQCIEVTGVTPGREVSFLAIPKQYIRRFRLRYFAGSQSNVVLSDWMYMNEQSVRNIRIAEDKTAWERLKKDYHSLA